MQTKYSAIINIFQPYQNKDKRRPRSVVTNGDLCKPTLFAQFLRPLECEAYFSGALKIIAFLELKQKLTFFKGLNVLLS
jgi:hypothetical protein